MRKPRSCTVSDPTGPPPAQNDVSDCGRQDGAVFREVVMNVRVSEYHGQMPAPRTHEPMQAIGVALGGPFVHAGHVPRHVNVKDLRIRVAR
jgi:hypothetical protein